MTDCSSWGSFLQEANSYKIAVRPERRRQFHREMASSVQYAFDLLSSCLRDGSIQVREQVRQLFQKYLYSGCMWGISDRNVHLIHRWSEVIKYNCTR